MGILHRFVSAKAQGGDATLASKDEWNDAHKLDLDGVIPGTRVGEVADRWYSQLSAGANPLTVGAPTAGRLRAFPFVPSKEMTLDRIAFKVHTLLAGSARVGIYSGDDNLYPSSLIVDGGPMDTGTAGVKSSVINVPVTGGEVDWLVFASSVEVSVRAFGIAGVVPILGTSNLLDPARGVGWDVAFAYGALPAIFPAGAEAITAIPLPAIFVRGV